MAEGIVSSVLVKLGDAAVKKILLIHGIDKQVETLSRELSWMQTFLKDADMMKIVNEGQKHWVKLVRDVAYDIDDVIDNAFISKVPENPSRELPRRGCSPIIGAAQWTWSKTKKLPALNNLADEMNEIMARIREINETRQRYGINSLGEGSGKQLRLRQNPVLPEIADPDVVGFNHDRDNIVNQLLDTRTERRVVILIGGPGGLGKTTLAHKVYNSYHVKKHFGVRIWVVVSQEYYLKDILRKIIRHVEPRSHLEGEEEFLLTKLYKTLNGKKYLLVLDDIWTSDLWNRIGGALPNGMIGSRVIITSRFLKVAKGAELYKLPYLDEKSSLMLFFKKALPNQDLSNGYHGDLFMVGKELVQKCGGLPLALVVLGGLLSTRPAIPADWSKMLQTMNWGIDGKECTEIMATSYNDLPLVLKACFMYLAIFPKAHEIDAQMLLWLWVAEGFIPAEDSKTLEDTAETFLEDLVQRSLVQVSQRSLANSIVSLRIHDLLREVVIQKAKEDNFLTIFSNPHDQKSNAKARRVAVHYSGCDELMEHANPNLRSLLCFEQPMPNCSRQKLLKVLSDMGQCRGQDVDFDCFHGQTQLRYCELSGSLNIIGRSFESFIGGLTVVQTLDFHQGDLGDLPDTIWTVKTLRHVMLRRYSLGPSSSANLINLQTLTGVKSRESWKTQLPNLPNVRDLDILVETSFPWDLIVKLLGTMKNLTCLSLFGYKIPQEIVNMQRFEFNRHLQSLSLVDWPPSPSNELRGAVGRSPSPRNELPIEVSRSPSPSNELPVEVGQSPSPRNELPVVVGRSPSPRNELPIMVGRSPSPSNELPVEVGWSPSPRNELPVDVDMFPIHVTELTLIGLQFKKDPMSELEKLCSLRILCLEGEEANRKMICSAGGFPHLHQLVFVGLKNLKEWEIKAGAMPKLKIVTLNLCSNLGVPLGFQYLSNLKELKVDQCMELRTHTTEIFNICKHVPYISIEGIQPSTFSIENEISSKRFNLIYFEGFLLLFFVSVLMLSFSFPFNLFFV